MAKFNPTIRFSVNRQVGVICDFGPPGDLSNECLLGGIDAPGSFILGDDDFRPDLPRLAHPSHWDAIQRWDAFYFFICTTPYRFGG